MSYFKILFSASSLDFYAYLASIYICNKDRGDYIESRNEHW